MRRRTRDAKSSDNPEEIQEQPAAPGQLQPLLAPLLVAIYLLPLGLEARNASRCIGDLFGNQKETACQENHQARKKDEPHEKSNA
jgi:hypothetical protein